MTEEKLDPDAYERLYLLNIESQNKALMIDIEDFCIRAKQHIVTSQDVLFITNLLRRYDAYFLSYLPIAKRLDQIGKQLLSKRLDEILYDIRETSTIFQNAYKKMLEKDKIQSDKMPC
jgi:DNA helicase IV